MRTAIVSIILAVIVAVILLMGGSPTGPRPYVVIGIVNGAIFGVMALGLVLVYKGTRVFNFMQAEFGTLAAYFLFIAIDVLNLPYFLGVLFALFAILVVGLIIEQIIIRPLIEAPRITVLVSTIAIALLIIGISILIFRIEPKVLSPLVEGVKADGTPRGIDLFMFHVEPQRVIAVGVLVALGAALAYFFSRTDLGLAVLATSQDAFATKVVGIGVHRMSRFIWGSAAVLGGIAGILYVPVAGGLYPAIMTRNILIPAFTGAVIGGMTSLPGAFVGGTIIGLVQALSLWASGHYYIGDTPIQQTIPGAEHIAIMAVLLLILLARPQGLLGKEA